MIVNPEKSFSTNPSKERQAFISMGSNIEPEKYLPLAVTRLKRIGHLIDVSPVYQNPAVGPIQQDDFLNSAALIETELSADEIRAKLREIEAELGRIRIQQREGQPPEAVKYAPRTIDLDLCILDCEIVDQPTYKLPDPDLLTRAHLAIPMADLAPDLSHPQTGERLERIADRLRSSSELRLRPDVSERLRSLISR